MIFITSNTKLHLLDNFWRFKTQNTEYNYIYVEIYENQTNPSVLAKIYKIYIMYTSKCDPFRNSLFPLLR